MGVGSVTTGTRMNCRCVVIYAKEPFFDVVRMTTKSTLRAFLNFRTFFGCRFREAKGGAPSRVLAGIDNTLAGGGNEMFTWVLNNMSKNGVEGIGGFTEGQLEEMGYKGQVRTLT